MDATTAISVASDGLLRCPWSADGPGMVEYHDTEWGFPVDDDPRLFEKLCLESFQSGLSWRTILTKRENFRRAFEGFEMEAVAGFGEEDITRLMGDAGIVRNRAKIEAVINNAARAQELIEREGSLAAFAWSYEAEPVEPQTMTTSPESVAMSKELKKRGWKFVGPTTAFAFMQAMGLVNDHLHGCAVRPAVDQARAVFASPARSLSPARPGRAQYHP